jgi:disulfide bond formation protein DsbB
MSAGGQRGRIGRQGRKHFFFEKKKQKTFVCFGWVDARVGAGDTEDMTKYVGRWVGLAGAVLAGLALAIALGSERFEGLIPCALCLRERWPYRVAIAVGLVASVLPGRAARMVCWVLVATYLVAGAGAFVHVGVEQRWWKSPLPECTAPDLRGLSPAERLARMPATPSVPCEDPVYLVPWVPVSMAQMNFTYALAVAAGLAIWLVRLPRRAR